jgi:hypothetical protein
VNIEAAMTRVRDIASQINQANPQFKPRPKSRFDQPSDSSAAREGETGQALLVPNGSSGAFGVANVPDNTVLSEANEQPSPEDVNDGHQGSEGSHSSHIVSRMDEASLRDNAPPQVCVIISVHSDLSNLTWTCRGMPGGIGTHG